MFQGGYYCQVFQGEYYFQVFQGEYYCQVLQGEYYCQLFQGEYYCQVCGERAGRHSYYGGQVCASCRAFFRRSVQSKYYELFACKKGQNCTVDVKNRKGCQFCRKSHAFLAYRHVASTPISSTFKNAKIIHI
jgi:hypothetical protein